MRVSWWDAATVRDPGLPSRGRWWPLAVQADADLLPLRSECVDGVVCASSLVDELRIVQHPIDVGVVRRLSAVAPTLFDSLRQSSSVWVFTLNPDRLAASRPGESGETFDLRESQLQGP